MLDSEKYYGKKKRGLVILVAQEGLEIVSIQI
jgi:hypothetical protein